MKILTNFATVVLLFLVGTFAGQAQTIYGDVNGDGEVTIADVNAVINVILGNYQPTSIVGSWYSEYFVDEDGKFDIPEVIAVSFDFYNDSTGLYSYRDKDDMVYLGLRWNLQGQRLYLWFDDESFEELYCKIDENGYMLLSLDSQFNGYTAYRPVNGSDDGKVSSQEESVGVTKSASRAIMERVKTED